MEAYLQDRVFLKKLMENRSRTIYVRVTTLDMDLNITDRIIGRPTEGSINVDGASAVRRSCNLTFVTDRIDISDHNWALNTRVKLEIGMANTTSDYLDVDIAWFPQGIYVITQFSMAIGTNSSTISISGQDKMCLLSGEVSGLLPSEIDFAHYDQLDAQGKVVETVDTPLSEIILTMVHTYGLEPLDNIVVELPEDRGFNLLTYRGENPLYLFHKRGENNTDTVVNFTFYGNIANDAGTVSLETLGTYWKPKGINKESEIQWGNPFVQGGQTYYIEKIEYGQTAGYEETPLTYAGELKAAPGEAVTSILDKIKNMLGDFEYFYDLEGKFIFRQKQTFLQTQWNEKIALEAFEKGEYSYEFNDLSMFTSFNNNPNIKNLKNDFTVWGEYKTATGAALPIHMRLAIDKKPTRYHSPWQDKTYIGLIQPAGTQPEGGGYDWRELIYQMAIDYYEHHLDPDYGILLEQHNSFVKNGRTGYEQYYQDIQGFWRSCLYEPDRDKAISAWERTPYNSDKPKYEYEWTELPSNITKFGEDAPVPYSSWYIDKAVSGEGGPSYRILWTESINLQPSVYAMYYSSTSTKDATFNVLEPPASIRRLYKYNKSTGDYSSIIDYPLIEGSYYIYERDIEDGSQIAERKNIAISNTWGVMELLENLYLKRPEDTEEQAIPMFNRFPINKMPGYNINKYRDGIYYQRTSNSRPSKCLSLNYYLPDSSGQTSGSISTEWTETDWNKAREAFATPDTRIQMDFGNNNIVWYEMSANNQNIPYVIGRYWPSTAEGVTHGVYYRTDDNQLKLYAQYLMDQGINKTPSGENADKYQIIDEYWLASAFSGIRDLKNNVEVSRDNLYRKTDNKDENGKPIFLPAFEDETLVTDTIYYRSSQLSANEITEPEEFETYYPTNLDGSLNTSVPQQKRMREYWTYVTDYDLNTYWKKAVLDQPETLIFWFDFLDPADYPELEPYSVAKAGSRPMIKNEKTVRAIYYPEVPNVYFGDDCPLQPEAKEYFTISSRGQSAHDTIDSWLYNHTYITESVSINSIPIYHLEPNSKIYIFDEEHGINGDYIVDKLTIPLAYNGTMSITATKAPETF